MKQVKIITGKDPLELENKLNRCLYQLNNDGFINSHSFDVKFGPIFNHALTAMVTYYENE